MNRSLSALEHLVEKTEDWSRLPANPLVSVAMSAYNHEAFISHALDSVLMQRVRFDYEIVLGEDKSTDRTREIVLDYQRRHPDMIRLRLARENLVSRGLKPLTCGVVPACRSRYIALLEGDDYWTDPLKLQKQVDFLEAHPECVVSFHNGEIIDVNKPTTKRIHFASDSKATTDVVHAFIPQVMNTIRFLISNNYILTCSVVFRNILSEHPWPSSYASSPAGDWVLLLHLSKYGYLAYQPDIMSVYRRHLGGVWSSLPQHDKSSKNAEIMRVLASDPEYSPEIRIAFLSKYLQYLRLSGSDIRGIYRILGTYDYHMATALKELIFVGALAVHTKRRSRYTIRFHRWVKKMFAKLSQR